MALEVTVKEQLAPEDVRCWAGQLLGGTAVFCGVEGHVIEGYLSPDTVEGFCCGDYEQCPSWRQEQDTRREKGKSLPEVMEQRRKTARERMGVLKELREQRAEALMRGNNEEALKFQARIRHYMRGGALTDRHLA